jgi:hypothetical protein
MVAARERVVDGARAGARVRLLATGDTNKDPSDARSVAVACSGETCCKVTNRVCMKGRRIQAEPSAFASPNGKISPSDAASQ